MDYCFGEVDFGKTWKNGQKRLTLVYEPLADDLAKIVTEKVFEKGGNTFIDLIPSWFSYALYTKASDEVLTARPEAELKRLDHIAARLRILCTSNTKSLATVDPARRSMRAKASLPLMERGMQVDKEGKNRCCHWGRGTRRTDQEHCLCDTPVYRQ